MPPAATVDGLLTHHAGVPSWEDQPAWQRAARGAGIDPARRWGAADGLDFVRGAAPVAAPAATPISNSHTTLLGLMIEAVAGRSCAEEIRRRVIGPFGLESAHLEGFEPAGTGGIAPAPLSPRHERVPGVRGDMPPGSGRQRPG